MNRFAQIIFLLALTIVHIGCSSDTAETNSKAANAANPANTQLASNGEPAQMPQNTVSKEMSDGFPAPANANVVVVDTSKAKDTMNNLSAPDDSTFSSEMNATGAVVETRKFNSHPQLAKVEKITANPRDIKFKVYLKNGKILNAPAEMMKDFRYISPVNILDAVGIKQPTDPNAPKAEDAKKPQLIPKVKPQ